MRKNTHQKNNGLIKFGYYTKWRSLESQSFNPDADAAK
jgi:hypothetical protein